ncbi:hypothetical protein Tco_0501197, partial [Tanacetum coccineum]
RNQRYRNCRCKMAKIQEVLPAESSSTDTPLEQVQNNDDKNVFANERQHSEKNSAECTDDALQKKQNEFEKYKAFNDRTIDYEILQTKLNET